MLVTPSESSGVRTTSVGVFADGQQLAGDREVADPERLPDRGADDADEGAGHHGDGARPLWATAKSPPQSTTLTEVGDSGDADSAHQWRVSPDRRDTLPVVPLDYEVKELPNWLQGCGCAECPERVSPLGDDTDVLAADACPSPRPLTLAEARHAYRRFVGGQVGGPHRSAPERHARLYGRANAFDRRIRALWGGDLTTVLLSLRASPLDDSGRVVTPLQQAVDLRDAWQAAVPRWRYQLRDKLDVEVEYIGVVAGTKHWASPHLHWLGWVRDPDDEVAPQHFKSTVDKFVDEHPRASAADHRIDEGGDCGCVTVRHNPSGVDTSPDDWSKVRRPTWTYVDADGQPWRPSQTPGAVYTLAQLPHLPLHSAVEWDEGPLTASEAETGVLAAVNPYQMVYTSNGV